MARLPRLELGVVLIKGQVPYPLGVRRREVGREGFEPPKRKAARLQRVDLTNGRADPEREDGASRITSCDLFDCQCAGASRPMAGSRVEAPYRVTRRCITFCYAGAQRIELCRRGFWRPSGYLSLTPRDCSDLSRPAGLEVYQVVTG
jgi:hypothetical protein